MLMTFRPTIGRILLHSSLEFTVMCAAVVMAFVAPGFWIGALVIVPYYAYTFAKAMRTKLTVSEEFIEASVWRLVRIRWDEAIEVKEEGLQGISRLLPGIHGFVVRGVSEGRQVRIVVEDFGFQKRGWAVLQEFLREKKALAAPARRKAISS